VASEYRVEWIRLDDAQRFLNAAARDGWELVSAIALGDDVSNCTVFLRRDGGR
jgi:hypothetical protein